MKLEHTDHCLDSSSGVCICPIGEIEDALEELEAARKELAEKDARIQRLERALKLLREEV